MTSKSLKVSPGGTTVLKRYFRDNFVIFRRRSKRIACLESVNSYTCVYMQIINFCGHMTPFRPPSGASICQFAWSQTLQTSKRHTFRVSAFHRYHLFGVKLFSVGYAQDSRRVPYPKNAKNAVFASGSAHATKFRNFSR